MIKIPDLRCSPEEAVDFIRNMCRDYCAVYCSSWDCSGARTEKCTNIKKEFVELWKLLNKDGHFSLKEIIEKENIKDIFIEYWIDFSDGPVLIDIKRYSDNMANIQKELMNTVVLKYQFHDDKLLIWVPSFSYDDMHS